MNSLLIRIPCRIALATLYGACAVIIGFFTNFSLTSGDLTPARILLICSLVLALIVFFVVLFLPLGKDPENAGTLVRVRLLMVLCMVGFLAWQLIDGPAVAEHYSQADLESRNPDINATTPLLGNLASGCGGKIPDLSELMKAEILQEIELYQKGIEDSWAGIVECREIITKLASYPVFLHAHRIHETSPPQYSLKRSITRIYLLYAMLQARQGNIPAAIDLLVTVESLGQRGMAGSTNVIEKMTWTAILRETLRTAFQISEEYPLTRQDLRRLRDAFPRYTLTDLNLVRAYIGEYLGVKNAVSLPADQLVAIFYLPGVIDPPLLLQLIPGWLMNAFYRLTFQKNRTLAVLDDFWSTIIEQAGRGLERTAPPETISDDGHYSRLPPLRNLSGWYFFLLPSYFTFEKYCVNLRVTSDLFAYSLGQRLGSDPVIEDYYSHKPNAIQQGKRSLRAAGKDTIFGTEDDIILETFY